MRVEGLSFEPVYEDGCTLAPTISMARTMRFKQLGIAKGKQPTGTTVDASCGNRCALRRSMSFYGGGRALAGSGPARHEDRKADGGRVSRPAGVPHRFGIAEQAAGRRGRFGCGADAAILDAVPACGRHPNHAHRNLGGAGKLAGKSRGLSPPSTHSPTHKFCCLARLPGIWQSPHVFKSL